MSTPVQLAPGVCCHCCTDDDLQGLRRDYPEWGVWRSGTGRWWAFRTGLNPLTIEQLRAGCRLIVQADTLRDLREMIDTETHAAQRVC